MRLMKHLKYNEWIYVFVKLLKVNIQAMKNHFVILTKELTSKN